MENFYSITDVNSEPLSFDREIALLRSWKKYKRKSARETLVKNYLLFTLKTVKRFYPTLAEDDAVLLANRTLLISIDKFDAEREKVGRLCNLIPLYIKVSYRKFRRESELVKCPVKNTPEGGRYISLDQPTGDGREGSVNAHTEHDEGIPSEEAPEIDLNELLGVEDPDIDKEECAERHEAVKQAILGLDERQKAVVMFVYYDKLDYAATARKMKPACSREWVRQLHDRAIGALRDALKKTEHL